jgi:hypothetical protein
VNSGEDERQAAAHAEAEEVRTFRFGRVDDRQQVLHLDLDRHGADRSI